MKKLLIVGILLPLAILSANSNVRVIESNINKITLSVSLPPLNIKEEQADSKTFSQLYFTDADISTEIGSPQLPVIRELVEIPFDASLDLAVNIFQTERIRLYAPVLPLQPSIPKSGPPPEFTMNKEVYNYDDFLLKERARVEMIGEIRGHRIALIEIYPVTYNPKQNTIEYASEMTIELNLAGANIGKTIEMRNRYYSKPYEMMLSNLVKNYDAYALTPPPDLPVGYLIIVPD
ncbi:MAG: C25 family peptidase propeptide domain-containing protein, partial [candidate division WOR-3 bacterium]